MVHLEEYLPKGNEGECEEQLVSVSLICNQHRICQTSLLCIDYENMEIRKKHHSEPPYL